MSRSGGRGSVTTSFGLRPHSVSTPPLPPELCISDLKVRTKYGDLFLDLYFLGKDGEITTVERMRQRRHKHVYEKFLNLTTYPINIRPRLVRNVSSKEIITILGGDYSIKKKLFIDNPLEPGLLEFLPETKIELDEALGKVDLDPQTKKTIKEMFDEAKVDVTVVQL